MSDFQNMTLIKGRNQITVKSVGISDFLQQLKDLPDWAFRIVIDEMRKQNMIERMTNVLEGWRAAITVGTNDGPLTGLSNR